MLYKTNYSLSDLEQLIKARNQNVECMFISTERQLSESELNMYKNIADKLKKIVNR